MAGGRESGFGAHYENMPMQYTEIFKVVKKLKIFNRKLLIVFLFLFKTLIVGTR